MAFGKVILLVGERGCGKTTLQKNYIKRLNGKCAHYIYAPLQNDFEGEIFQKFPLFAKKINSVKDSFVTIDEAYTVLPKKEPNLKRETDKNIVSFLVNCRKLNNFTFIAFHSMRQIPLWILDYSDFLLRFKTKDLINTQKMRFSSFPNIVESLEDNPQIDEPFGYEEILIR